MKKLQKANPVLAVAWCAATLWAGLILADNTDGDIPIPHKIFEDQNTLPPVKPTPVQQEADDFTKKMQAYYSLPRAWRYGDYTISVFSESCKWVVAGTVKEVEMLKSGPTSAFNCKVSLSVDARIYGKFPEKSVSFLILLRDKNNEKFDEMDRRIPKIGDRMLVFLRDLRNVVFRDTHLSMRNEAEWMGLPCSHFRAYVFLDDEETEEAMTNTVNKYIHTFSDGGKQDKDGYYEFLCSLLKSPVKRIRDDAELDLMLFFIKDPSLDLEKPLADDRVRKEIKDYLRYLIRNEKPKE